MSDYWLIPIAFLTSTISGFTGLGGGALLMGAMGFFISPTLLIPMHGAIQLASNVSRAGLSLKDLRGDIVISYLVGAVVGGLLGLRLVVRLPEDILWLSLGGFLLFMTWVPLPKKFPKVPFKYPLLGVVSTFLSLFVGITGPLLHPVILREGLDRHAFIGTEATCAGITHLVKVMVFSVIGVGILHHWPLIVPMVLASILGSFAGKLILGSIRQNIFVWLVRFMITILALRMLVKGLA